MSIDWLKGLSVYGQGWWEMVHDSTKTQSHLPTLFGVKNHIVCSSPSADVVKFRLQNWHPACRCKFWYSDVIYILPVWVTRGGQFQIVNRYYKEYRTQFGPLRDTGTYWENKLAGLLPARNDSERYNLRNRRMFSIPRVTTKRFRNSFIMHYAGKQQL